MTGTKRRIREQKKKEGYIGTIGASVIIAVVVIAIYSLSVHSPPNLPPNQTIESNKNTAAIIDGLGYSEVLKNQTFVDTTTRILQQAGYKVDYYPGKKVTVNLFRKLATYGYDLIILRVHSILTKGEDPHVTIFTTERYSKWKYTWEQEHNYTVKVRLLSDVYEDKNLYFGVTDDFFRYRMEGQFDNTTVLMMGCEGLAFLGYDYYGYEYYHGDMAKTFLEKGAKIFWSWDGEVMGSHTDAAMAYLLQQLIIERQTAEDAMMNTMIKVGPDPKYWSRLRYFPFELGNYTIPITSDLDPG